MNSVLVQCPPPLMMSSLLGVLKVATLVVILGVCGVEWVQQWKLQVIKGRGTDVLVKVWSALGLLPLDLRP